MRRFEQEVRGSTPIGVILALQDIPAGTIVAPRHLSRFEMPERYVSGRNIDASDRNNIIGTRVGTSAARVIASTWCC
jgi:hypothetical protein